MSTPDSRAQNENQPVEVNNNSPWTSAGCFIARHPILICVLLFVFFWVFRSQYYSGDGDQLCRMIEGRDPLYSEDGEFLGNVRVVWMVQTELASHAIFQLGYHVLHPFGWDAFSVINLVSCLAGVLSIFILLKFNERFVGVDPIWPLGLFLSSGLALYCNGHTEYYTLFLITLFYFGYTGVGYIKGQHSMLHTSFAFSAAVWMHLGILFALPALLLLPLLKKQLKDFQSLSIGLIPTVLAFLLKRYYYLLDIHIQGLSPSKNFIPLFDDPSGERFYLMFDWWHLADLLYAWVMRSWIFWPILIWCLFLFGISSLRNRSRLFLLTYTLCFTVFTLIWHPNLGIRQDWDLWAIEAAPCLLLLLTYLPDFLSSSFRKTALAIPIAASMLIVYSFILDEAQFDRRGYGGIELLPSKQVNYNFTLNGHRKQTTVPAIREGIYETKFINDNDHRVHDFYITVVPDIVTNVNLEIGPNLGRGSALNRTE